MRNRAYLAELAQRAANVEGVRLLASLGIRASYDQVVDLYALADVLVFPSESEGFGIPMLEAGLHRMPIVCSDIPALRETGGDDPLYVPPDANGEQIADAVERALDTPVMRMRARAREHGRPRGPTSFCCRGGVRAGISSARRSKMSCAIRRATSPW